MGDHGVASSEATDKDNVDIVKSDYVPGPAPLTKFLASST